MSKNGYAVLSYGQGALINTVLRALCHCQAGCVACRLGGFLGKMQQTATKLLFDVITNGEYIYHLAPTGSPTVDCQRSLDHDHKVHT